MQRKVTRSKIDGCRSIQVTTRLGMELLAYIAYKYYCKVSRFSESHEYIIKFPILSITQNCTITIRTVMPLWCAA
jgi:hypothetical protein